MTQFHRLDSGLFVPGEAPPRPMLVPISGGSASTYMVYNSAMATTAAPVKQATGGGAIRTMMQLLPATGVFIRVLEWGCSFDGSQAGVPGELELIDTEGIPATGLTAYAAQDIQTYGNSNAPANTAGSSGVPLNLSGGTSGYSPSGAVSEGAVVATRMGDIQQIAPTGQFFKQWPLSREFEVPPQHALRIRATFAVTVNMICYIVFEV